MASKPPRFSDRLLAEAVAGFEQLQPREIDSSSADAAARLAGGDVEERIVHRARYLEDAPRLQDALARVRNGLAMVILAGLVVATVAGAGAARAALSSPRGEPVNFFFAFALILGPQTLLLLLWLAIMILSPRHNATAMAFGSLGGLLFRAAKYVVSRFRRGPHQAAAVAAYAATYTRGSLGKWSLSAISHGLWLAFNVSCLMVVVTLLSAWQYAFAWETTILSERYFQPMTRAIAALPELAGFITPTNEQIAASQWPFANGMVQEIETSRAWSGLLLGSIVLYGFAPRLLLLALALGQRRVATSRYRLDISRPELTRLHSRLMESPEAIGVIDADDYLATPVQQSSAYRASPRPIGPPAILGFELPARTSKSAWPPPLHSVRWLDLGMVDTREDQHRVLDQLARSEEEPMTVVVACSLTSTPDRGVAGFMRNLQVSLTQPVTMLLTGGHSLRQRSSGADFEQRVDDWRNLVLREGVPPQRIIEIDLDHVTQASAARLASLVSGGEAAAPQRRIEVAFDVITQTAERWFGTQREPSTADQIELHRSIGGVYRDDQANWRELLRAPSALSVNVAEQLRSSATRMIDLLPMNLRRSPKWIAAGTAAGALGCIAAATMLTPLAITALPLWSAIGAGLGALASLRPQPKHDQPRAMEPALLAETIRAAALFALLLELQGREEKSITRILERIFEGEEVDKPLDSTSAVRRWLDQLRHRLDMALAQERPS